MLQLLFNLADEFFALLIDGILGVEEFASLVVAAAFDVAELLLVGNPTSSAKTAPFVNGERRAKSAASI